MIIDLPYIQNITIKVMWHTTVTIIKGRYLIVKDYCFKQLFKTQIITPRTATFHCPGRQ